MRVIFSLLMVISIFLGGCQMSEESQTTDPAKVDAENLPSVRAFEDKFTREFLQSIEETRDGYYPFKSKTNHYVMDFPEGGLVGERGYSLQDNSESYLVGVEGEDTDSQISIKYLGFMKHEFKDSRIETLIDSSEATLKFDTKDLDDRSISTAFFKEDNGYFGYSFDGPSPYFSVIKVSQSKSS